MRTQSHLQLEERGEKLCHIQVSINGVVVDEVVAPQPKLPSFLRCIRISENRPAGVKDINVRLAGDGASISASFPGEVEIELGEYHCQHPVYVAALQYSMLLGIDLLQANPICLSCGLGEFWFSWSTEARKMHKPNPVVRVNAV